MRPEGWKNPYVECNKVCKKIYNGKPFDAVEMAAFEAGADAYEEGLEKKGYPISGNTVFTYDAEGTAGYLVFIPEEKE